MQANNEVKPHKSKKKKMMVRINQWITFLLKG